MKAPFPKDEKERINNLESYQILDSLDEQTWDDIAFLASSICDTPIAAVSFVDRERQWFKSIVGLDAKETHRDLAFCAHAILQETPLIVPSALDDSRFYDNGLVTSGPQIRFYAGAQINSREGYKLGTLCVIDQKSRQITATQVQALEALSRQITSLLNLRADNRDLKVAKENAEQLSQTKSLFLANMSHELRTPLNAVMGYSELLIEEAEDDENLALKNDLTKIHTAGRHLLELINDILDLSKIEAGKMEVYLERFSLASIFREIKQTMQPLVHTNNNALGIKLDVEQDLILNDKQKIKQIIYNLVSNSCKFTENGKIEIHVCRDPLSHQLTISVSDTGIGINKETLAKLFQNFIQADASTTRKYGGTGLGLALSQKFAQLLEGEITVESEEHKGSCFRLILPEQSEQVKTEAISEQTAREPGDEQIAKKRPVVLIIDDDQRVHEILQRSLNHENYHLISAKDGEEGLKKALTLKPDIITLDVMMPNLDGWSVLKSIRSEPTLKGVPVIMMTMVDNQILGNSLGASEFLTKPVQPQKLRALIRQHLNHNVPKVLVIDEEMMGKSLLKETLIKNKISFIELNEKALDLNDLESKPEILLLDLIQPRVNILTFMESLKNKFTQAELPLIIMTASKLSLIDQELLKSYMHVFYQKNNDSPDHLLNEINALIQNQ